MNGAREAGLVDAHDRIILALGPLLFSADFHPAYELVALIDLCSALLGGCGKSGDLSAGEVHLLLKRFGAGVNEAMR